MPVAPSRGAFVDTNVLLYLLSSDAAKAGRAEALLAARPTISVQVLNEFASVARRKFGMPWDEVADVLALIRRPCVVRDLTLAVHDAAIPIARRHQVGWYDALLLAAALDAGCMDFYSEDMHTGLRVNGSLTIRNPFK